MKMWPVGGGGRDVPCGREEERQTDKERERARQAERQTDITKRERESQTCRQRDKERESRHTDMTKLIVAFRNFANTPKMR